MCIHIPQRHRSGELPFDCLPGYFLDYEFPDRSPFHFFGGVTEQLLFRAIDPSDPPVTVQLVISDRRIVEEVFELGLTRLHGFLRSLALRDVSTKADQANDLAALIAQGNLGRRSEERRVGKECRCRRSSAHTNEKNK